MQACRGAKAPQTVQQLKGAAFGSRQLQRSESVPLFRAAELGERTIPSHGQACFWSRSWRWAV